MENNYPPPPPPLPMNVASNEVQEIDSRNLDVIANTIAQHPKFKVGIKTLSESMKEKRAILESKLKEIKSPEIIEKMRKFTKIKESIEKQNELEQQKQRELDRQKELERLQSQANLSDKEFKANESYYAMSKSAGDAPVVNMIKLIFDIFDTLSNKTTKEETNEIDSLKAEITDLRNEVLDLRNQLNNIHQSKHMKKNEKKSNKKRSKHRPDKHHTRKPSPPLTHTNKNRQNKHIGKHVLDIIST